MDLPQGIEGSMEMAFGRDFANKMELLLLPFLSLRLPMFHVDPTIVSGVEDYTEHREKSYIGLDGFVYR